jgi:Mrp family chromosome partitioning ATPase
MGTEREIALSGNVAGLVAHKLRMTEHEALKHLSVAVPVDAMALQFSYTAPSSDEAYRGARLFTDAYIADRNGTGKQGAKAGQKGSGKGAQAAVKAAAKAAKNPVVVEQITAPNHPKVADAPNLPLILGLSVVLGGLVGLGAALLWDRSSDRLRGVVDLGEQTGLPVLTSVPTFSEPLTLSPTAYTSVAAREVYGHLATQMPRLLDARWGVSALVTSPSRSAGKSTTAAQLAVSLALMGKDVVLVEADLRNPVLEDWFWLPPGPGISEVLAGKVPLERAVRGTDYEHLQVLTAGQVGIQENVVFDLEDVQLIIGRLARSGLVILDAPTCTEAAETAQLASRVDQVVLVCDVRRGLRRDARAAVVALSHVLDKVAGTVANRPVAERPHSRRKVAGPGQEIAVSPEVEEPGTSPIASPTRPESESPSPVRADK